MFCEDMANIFKETEPTAMYDLGLEFLRVYDGKFNYSKGHRVCLFYFPKLKLNIDDNLVCNAFSKENLVFNN
jgi:hypothetical protein